MSDTLPVEHEQVGLFLQRAPCCQNCGALTKCQQSGDVGKEQRRIFHSSFDWGELRVAQHNDCRPGELAFDAHIHAADRADRTPVPSENQAISELLLDLHRFLWGQIPVVQLGDHRVYNTPKRKCCSSCYARSTSLYPLRES